MPNIFNIVLIITIILPALIILSLLIRQRKEHRQLTGTCKETSEQYGDSDGLHFPAGKNRAGKTSLNNSEQCLFVIMADLFSRIQCVVQSITRRLRGRHFHTIDILENDLHLFNEISRDTETVW